MKEDEFIPDHGPSPCGEPDQSTVVATATLAAMPYFCPACQAIPTAGYCRLKGCPTAPENEASQ